MPQNATKCPYLPLLDQLVTSEYHKQVGNIVTSQTHHSIKIFILEIPILAKTEDHGLFTKIWLLSDIE